MTPARPAPPEGVTFFVPCALKNFANHGGHWIHKAGYQQRLRDKTQVMAWAAMTDGAAWFSLHQHAAKRVWLTAYVWNIFDEHDGLRNACKPLVDGLVRAKLLNDDKPGNGHSFVYAQEIRRKERGVMITVEPK